MSLEECNTSLFCLIFYMKTFVPSIKKRKDTMSVIIMDILYLQGALLMADWYLYMKIKRKILLSLIGCNVDIGVFPLVIYSSL